MKKDKISSGSRLLDIFLEGGLDKGSVTTVYGPPATGKTCICMLCAIDVAKSKKVIYVDTESNFSFERLKQMSNDYERILKHILIYKPKNFYQQKEFFEKLVVNGGIGIVIVDTISKHYRLALAKSFDKQKMGRVFNYQLNLLLTVARQKNICILLTSQVYDDFKTKNKISVVGGNWIRNRSDCLIELQITPFGNRKAILVKHPSIIKQKIISFKITQKGIE